MSGPTRKRRWLFVIVLALLAPLVAVALLAGLALEDDPLVVRASLPTVASAQRVKMTAKTMQRALRAQRELTEIALSEGDLDAVMLLGGRGVRRFAGQIFIRPGVLHVQVSLQLPRNPWGRYLNLRGDILPGERGLHTQGVAIGALPVPGWLVRTALKAVLNGTLGSNDGSVLLESIRSLDIVGDTVVVKVAALAQNKERLQRLQQRLAMLTQLGQDGNRAWDTAAIVHYYTRLLETERRLQPAATVTLAEYLGPLFQLARARSVTGDPVQENSSALLALSLYLGHPLFDKLARVNLPEKLLSRSAHLRQVTVAGRQDLRRHFVVSAGLQVLSEQSISSAIGEFKELLDANRGGSGFSFVDLAADRAGIRFAQVATGSSAGARRLQELLAGRSGEALFFPSIGDLPENMPQTEFERRYHGLDSPAYQRLVEEIDRRIGRCAVYQGS